MANKFEAEAARLKRVYDANRHKTAVQNMYGDVSALLDRLDAREGALKDGGRAVAIAVDNLCHKMRNA